MVGIPKGYQQTQIPRMSPEQLEMFQQMLSGLGQYIPGGIDYLGKLALGDEGAFDKMSAPMMRNFNEKLIPGMQAHFGKQGMLGSSAFNNAAAGAAGDLSAQLGAQRQQLQMDALYKLLGLGNQALDKQPYEYGLQKKNNWWDYMKEGVGMGTDIAGAVAAFL